MARTSNGSNGTTKKNQNYSTNGSSNGSSSNGSSSKNGSSKSGKKSEKTLEDLFEAELKDIYSAENQLLEALPEMAKAADNEDLQDAFEKHLQETKRQVERIEKVFDRLGIEHEEETCEAMQGLIKEGKHIIREFDRSAVRDSALIIAAQKVEHYEIASYGSLCELADVLGYSNIVDILERSLQEEEQTDRNLTTLAMDVNDEACAVNHQEEELA